MAVCSTKGLMHSLLRPSQRYDVLNILGGGRGGILCSCKAYTTLDGSLQHQGRYASTPEAVTDVSKCRGVSAWGGQGGGGL
jgi:hypothetical protein